MAFTQLKLHPALLKAVKELGFVRPTPIQAESIPPALERRDLIACAQTGSGKTASFLLPIVHHLIDKPRRTTRALVLAPTRELAAQILDDLNALAVHTPVTGAAIFGGVGMGPQEHAFRSGVDIIIATPGRLLDHLKQSYARLNAVEHLVLDEADRMLDMGFLPEIRKILKYLPAKRQTLFFSATMPPPIAVLAQEMLHQPATIQMQRQAAPASGITQAVYPVPQELKAPLMVHLLTKRAIRQALVFTRTKHRANRLADFLVQHGIQAERIHGNRSQSQRMAALDGFKSGRFPVLVATDIAARGIDVESLGHVVNFDVPKASEDYIHRVGRTGRAEATGEAFTLVSPDEENDLRDIERAVGRRLPRVTEPDFDYTARPKGKFEVPLAQRIAEIRAKKREERERQKINEARRAAAQRAAASRGGAGRGGAPQREVAADVTGAQPNHRRELRHRPGARGAGGQGTGSAQGQAPQTQSGQGQGAQPARPHGPRAQSQRPHGPRPQGQGGQGNRAHGPGQPPGHGAPRGESGASSGSHPRGNQGSRGHAGGRGPSAAGPARGGSASGPGNANRRGRGGRPGGGSGGGNSRTR